MKKEAKSNTKTNVKSDVLTGASSAVGATIGMVAGSAAASEVHAAEMQETDEQSVPLTGSAGAAPTQTIQEEVEVVPVNPDDTETSQDAAEQQQMAVVPEETSAVDSEIVVTGYGTVDNEDGSRMDVVTVNVDGQEASLIDIDQDGIADVLMVDVDGDGDYDESEILNIGEEAISMAVFQPDGMEEAHTLIAENDYVNDANVDEYMA